MNSKVLDPAFGEMLYKHSWSRTETISWWGNCEVNITAKAFSGDEITEEQRAAFQEYINVITDFISKAIPKIAEYLSEMYEYKSDGSHEDLRQVLHPKTVLFLKSGSWGVLFDSEIDIENGLGVFGVNGEIKVGMQDEFI